MRGLIVVFFVLVSAFCSGQISCDCGAEPTLTTNPSGLNYSWSNGANTQSTTLPPQCSSSSYIVTVSDSCGSTDTDNFNVSICNNTNASINDAFYVGSAQICLLFIQNITCCDTPNIEWTDPNNVVVSTSSVLNAGNFTTCGVYCASIIDCNGCTSCNWTQCYNIQNGQPNSPDCCTSSCENCTANIQASNTPNCNTSVTFSNNPSCNYAGTTYSWNINLIGTGVVASGTSSTINYTFTANGTYNVTLTVTDECNNTTTDTNTYVVSNCTSCETCIANINASSPPICNSTITFSNSPICNFPGTTYGWAITLIGTGNVASGTGPILSYTFSTSGTYVVTLSVTDQCSNTTTDSNNYLITGCVDCNCNAVAVADDINCEIDVTYTGTGCSNYKASILKRSTTTCSGSSCTLYQLVPIPPTPVTVSYPADGTGIGGSTSCASNFGGTDTGYQVILDDNAGTGCGNIFGPCVALNCCPSGGCTANIFTSHPNPLPCSSTVFFTSTGCPSAISHTWSVTLNSVVIATGSGVSFSHLFNQNGNYVVTLTVLDDCNVTTTDTDVITVNNCCVEPNPILSHNILPCTDWFPTANLNVCGEVYTLDTGCSCLPSNIRTFTVSNGANVLSWAVSYNGGVLQPNILTSTGNTMTFNFISGSLPLPSSCSFGPVDSVFDIIVTTCNGSFSFKIVGLQC